MTLGHSVRRMDLTVVSIPVSDQDRSLAFYRDQLGFDVIVDVPWQDARWIQLVAPGGQTTIALVTWFDALPPGAQQGLILETHDVAADYAALKDRGVTFTAPPTEEFFGTHADFADPDGNGWSLLQSPAGMPTTLPRPAAFQTIAVHHATAEHVDDMLAFMAEVEQAVAGAEGLIDIRSWQDGPTGRLVATARWTSVEAFHAAAPRIMSLSDRRDPAWTDQPDELLMLDARTGAPTPA